MTSRTYADYLRDILDNCDKIEQFVRDVSFENFERDHEKVYAVMLALVIIGEAAKQIPASARRRYSKIPWREVTGIRDKVAHHYYGVNRRLLWQTVQTDISSLRAIISQMLADLDAK